MNTIRTPIPTEELDILRGQKGHTCVSIIVPIHRQQPDRKIDELYVGQAVKRAADLLHLQYPEEAEDLSKAVQQLASTIDFNHCQEGLGLFVSDGVRQIVHYPFTVARKIVVNKKFELRDLLYKTAYSSPYYVLILEEEKASLYYGVLQYLEAVDDQNFPCLAMEDYDYQHPVRDSSYAFHAYVKSFEQDQSEYQNVRYRTFIAKVDDLLGDYLTGETNMILCGQQQYTASFLNQSRHDVKVISVLTGNYSKLTIKELAALIFPIIEASLYERMTDEISRLEEMAGQGLTEEGFDNVRQAISEGRAQKLFVEKEYPYPDTSYKEKSLHTPKDLYGEAAADAVEGLIVDMLDKKGQVLLVEKDMLKTYGHIALITRY